jgi:crotonobetaine/carnitine-CoA ligase
MKAASFSFEFDRAAAPELIRKRAEATPDRIALQDINGRTRNFQELHENALRWAGALIRTGVQPGDRVASLLPNSIEVNELWLGLGWAHAWDVSVNTAYRGDILRHVLTNSEPRVIILAAPYVAQFAEIADDLPWIETVVVWGGALPHGLSAKTFSLEDFLQGTTPALLEPPKFSEIQGIVYTSGTTGLSKGALLPWGRHSDGAAMILFRAVLNEADVWYSDFPACHNSAKITLRVLSAMGIKCVIAAEYKTDRFWSDIRKFNCTATMLLPNMQNWLVNAPGANNDKDHPLRNISGYGPDLIRFGQRFGVNVHINYGSTEGGNTLFHFNAVDSAGGYAGRAEWPFEAQIVDDDDFPVPVGTPGRLATRCAQPWMIFQGYYGMPKATENTLRNGWFHTGDLVRTDSEGRFFFLDRHSDYIRRRGENISSFEVERAVINHPAVSDAAAIGVQSAEGEDEVKICVCLKTEQVLTAADLLEFLRPRLPAFMIPRFVQFFDVLPMTPTHKVQKSTLRADPINADTYDSGAGRRT